MLKHPGSASRVPLLGEGSGRHERLIYLITHVGCLGRKQHVFLTSEQHLVTQVQSHAPRLLVPVKTQPLSSPGGTENEGDFEPPCSRGLRFPPGAVGDF